MNTPSFYIRHTLHILLLAVSLVTIWADTLADNRTFSIRLENDIFAHSDGDYTSGMELLWSQAYRVDAEGDTNSHECLQRLAATTLLGRDRYASLGNSFSVGQKMFTPQDLRATELVVSDRPYAGWSYISFAAHGRNGKRLDSIGLTLGIVGPSSYAEFLQRSIHELLDNKIPSGWDNQLKDEVGLNLLFLQEKRIWHRPMSTEFEMELVSSKQIVLGSVDTSASYGWRWKIGHHLTDDFNTGKISHADPGFLPERYFDETGSVYHTPPYLFLSVEATESYVDRNLFLDGNNFQSSHRVEKESWVSEVSLGFTYGNNNFRAHFLYTYRGKEFTTQNGGAGYGTITFSYRI